jgi:hypothetical protein
MAVALFGVPRADADNSPLHFFHVVPGFVPVLPPGVGTAGTEAVAAMYALGTRALGHEVSMFAAEGSNLPGITMHLGGPANNSGTDPQRKQLEIAHARHAVRRLVELGLWDDPNLVIVSHTSELAPFLVEEATRGGAPHPATLRITHNFTGEISPTIPTWEHRATQFDPDATLVLHPGITVKAAYDPWFAGTRLERLVQPHPVDFGSLETPPAFASAQAHRSGLEAVYRDLRLAEHLTPPRFDLTAGNYFVSFGQLRKHKGHHNAVALFKHLRDTRPEQFGGHRLVVMGDITETPNSRGYVNELLLPAIGGDSAIELWGRVSPQVRDAAFARAAGVFALLDPSYLETFGLGGYEAALRNPYVLAHPNAVTHDMGRRVFQVVDHGFEPRGLGDDRDLLGRP